jgi:hypothetical protein
MNHTCELISSSDASHPLGTSSTSDARSFLVVGTGGADCRGTELMAPLSFKHEGPFGSIPESPSSFASGFLLS